MGKVKPIRMEDIEAPNYAGDGESTVQIFDAPTQLEPSDGESTFDVGEVAGAERVTESVEGAAAATLANYTSAPTHAPDPGKPEEPKLDVPIEPTPTQSAERAAEKADEDEAPKRTRRTKAQIEADEKAEAEKKAAADADSK